MMRTAPPPKAVAGAELSCRSRRRHLLEGRPQPRGRFASLSVTESQKLAHVGRHQMPLVFLSPAGFQSGLGDPDLDDYAQGDSIFQTV